MEKSDLNVANEIIFELQDRIDKAIEYIQNRYDGEALTHTFDKDNVGELLDTLKGSEEIMNKEQMNKYSYELMVKNNSDEAIKNLLLKDKEIEKLHSIIKEAIEYIEQNTKQVVSTFYGIPDCEVFDGNIKDIVKILKRSDKE